MDRVLRSLPCVKFLWAQYSNKGNGRLAREIFFFFLKWKMSQGGVVLILPLSWRRCFTMQSAVRVCEIANCPQICAVLAQPCSPCTYLVQTLYHTGPAGKRPALQSTKRHKYFFHKNRHALHHQIWKQEDLSSRWQQQTSLESKDSICRLQKALCRTVRSALHLPEVCSFHSL